MPNLFECKSSDTKSNAQRNLIGRTHYVDDDTLRFHKSKVLSARASDNGLLFAITTSDALDYQGTKRGFRFVIFDIFGTVLERPDLESAFKTHAAATKAMWEALNSIDAKAVTLAGIANAEKWHASEMADLRKRLETI